MEVHAHSHTPRKKWTHYFWEFFMLFLAVTLGFFVENQREHFIEGKKEKQYILSFVQDLQTDTAYFVNNLKINAINQDRMDSLLLLLKKYTLKSPTNDIYFLAKSINSRGNRLQYNSRTFEQLKNSGGLRLIRNRPVIDALTNYYESLKWIDVQNQLRIERQHDLILANAEIFDTWIMKEINEQNYKTVMTFPLLTNDKKTLNQYASRLFHFKGVDFFLQNRVKDSCLPKAQRLIAIIKKEYRLK